MSSIVAEIKVLFPYCWWLWSENCWSQFQPVLQLDRTFPVECDSLHLICSTPSAIPSWKQELCNSQSGTMIGLDETVSLARWRLLLTHGTLKIHAMSGLCFSPRYEIIPGHSTSCIIRQTWAKVIFQAWRCWKLLNFK